MIVAGVWTGVGLQIWKNFGSGLKRFGTGAEWSLNMWLRYLWSSDVCIKRMFYLSGVGEGGEVANHWSWTKFSYFF